MSKKSNATTSMKQNSKVEYQFKKSVFFPWTKVKMSLANNQLQVIDRKRLLWMIPIGQYNEKSYPLQYISKVEAKYGFGLYAFLAGILLLYFYLTMVVNSLVTDVIVGLVFIFVFSFFLISGLYCLSKGLSYKLYLINNEKKKQATTIDISYWEKEKLQEFVNEINKAIKKH
ncbi:hypothetical protein MK805_03805 [Shimazuella sp. AN120528]|uniref:hypothetical protein n=1 Tax=Shimazuella soli TaxID=1892854 RepID=UPI001F0E6D4C|nr:hypothetical protein [Shimazuella soli]MCH5584090.1 hypothetical protein [Shimazuella soli]